MSNNSNQPEEKKMIGDPSPQAIDFAKRMIALKWTKETNVDVVAGNWQAGYVRAQVEANEYATQLKEENQRLREALRRITEMPNSIGFSHEMQIVASEALSNNQIKE